ncbi:MAG: ABC transporter [Rhodanobacter sp. 68-29]|nr:ABC transporter permease [Rhodanobacter sp.]ODU75075.1 MAG: ABC transporter [Rhodanobacter sp. SCN 69-32]OJY55353.1 MAG: ABC transporter [Rhodanobacter sp. 68-29]
MSLLLSAAWRYRGFVVSSVVNEFKARLQRSRLGTAWVVLQPLAQVLIYATVLSNVLAAKLQGVNNKYAYAAYLVAGSACWALFAEIVQRCLTIFIDFASLLKKIQFPRITLPLIVAGSATVNNVALVVAALLILPVLGFYPHWNLLWLPVLMVLTVALAAGLGLLFGTLNVFMRDVSQIVPIVLQFWFWFTPIVYPSSIIPASLQRFVVLNPILPLVEGYQNVLVYGKAPPPGLLGVAVASVLLLLVTMFLFRRASAEMVDVL